MRRHRELEEADYLRMNLPAEFWKYTPKDVPADIRDPVARYCDCDHIDGFVNDGVGWFFWGPPGFGKTTTAAVLAKEVRSHAYTVLFTTVSDLREMIRSHIVFDDTVSALERAQAVDFLVLDSIREEDAKDSWFDAVDIARLVERRLSWKKPTIFTTRLDSLQFEEIFPDAMELLLPRCLILNVKPENEDTKSFRKKAQEELQVRLGLKKAEAVSNGPR
jgi:DNA replication protein DnaC